MKQFIFLVLSIVLITACSEAPRDSKSTRTNDSLNGGADAGGVVPQTAPKDAGEQLGDDQSADVAGNDQDDLQLIGGTVADPAAFPASVYISAGNSRCSATVVGSRVVMTAAHCVSNGGSIRFSVGPNRYTATCRHHPSYRNNSTADWALCLTNVDVLGITYEVVNQNPDRIENGNPILLTGYGCTIAGGRGGNDGRYRVGESTIIREPQANGSNHDIVAKGQGAALCYGDSGGPAFIWLDAAKTQRVLVGVNSRGDIRTTSYLSSVSQPTAQTWISSWMESNQAKICGLSPDATGCRHGSSAGGGGGVSTECLAMQASNALSMLTKCANEPITNAAACLTARDEVSRCLDSKIP